MASYYKGPLVFRERQGRGRYYYPPTGLFMYDGDWDRGIKNGKVRFNSKN